DPARAGSAELDGGFRRNGRFGNANGTIVLSADLFLKDVAAAQGIDCAVGPADAAIDLERGPGHGEGARIIDRETHLVVLSAVRTGRHANALDHVFLGGMRRVENVYRRLVVEPDRIDDERVALEMADGIAVPAGLRIGNVRLVQMHDA